MKTEGIESWEDVIICSRKHSHFEIFVFVIMYI